jgi:hypothetical protein
LEESDVKVQKIHLVRDVLDCQLIDKKDDPMGRVDGIVIVEEEGKQPRVAELQGGIVVLGERLGKRIGKWVRLIAMRWGLKRGQRTRVKWRDVRWIHEEMKVDVNGDRTPALVWENWLGEKVIARLPRSK